MRVINKKISIVIPTPKQPRFHKRIAEYSIENHISLFYFNRMGYNSLNTIPNVDKSFNLGFIKSGGSYLKRIPKLFKLFKLLRVSESDIIYAFGLDLLLVSVFSKRKSTNIWFELGDIRELKNKHLETLFVYFYKLVVFKNVDLISVTSQGSKDYLQKKYNIHSKKIIIKENLLLKNDFIKKEVLTKELVKPFVVGILGYLRYDAIISFLEEYLKRDNNFVIHIYGQGELVEKIKEIIINTNIKYFGEFKYPEGLIDIYKNIHFSYVLYDNEDLNVRLALPNKLYESIFFKTPILVSKNTYLCQKVKHEFQIGECFDPENQHELIDYLNNISLLKNYNLFINNIEKINKKHYIK